MGLRQARHLTPTHGAPAIFLLSLPQGPMVVRYEYPPVGSQLPNLSIRRRVHIKRTRLANVYSKSQERIAVTSTNFVCQ